MGVDNSILVGDRSEGGIVRIENSIEIPRSGKLQRLAKKIFEVFGERFIRIILAPEILIRLSIRQHIKLQNAGQKLF